MKTTVLALYPTLYHIGYAYFEGRALVDWSVTSVGEERGLVRRIAHEGLARATELTKRFEPEVILLPVIAAKPRRYQARFVRALQTVLNTKDVRVICIDDASIRKQFNGNGGTRTISKQRIAGMLCERFPELKRVALPENNRWQAQDYWIPMFNAVAIAVTWITNHE